MRSGGHVACVLKFNGKSRFTVFPGSASDYRGALNHIADLRAELRNLGAERVEVGPAAVKPAEPRRPPPAPPPRSEPKPPVITDPREGGFGPLAHLRARLDEQSREEIAKILLRWEGREPVPERLEEAARALVASWHPDIIERAHELLVAARRTHAR